MAPVIYTPTHPLVVSIADHFLLRADLLSAQIVCESGGDPNAFRYERGYFVKYLLEKPNAVGFTYGPLAASSYGLLQIVLETALELGFVGEPQKLFYPAVGALWGARYLRQCLDRSGGDYLKALARYNGQGPAAYDYARKVIAIRDAFTPGPVPV